MSLRTKLLALFLLLAVGPLVGVGVFGYLQPRRALEHMLTDQAQEIATRVSVAIGEQFAASRSDAELLSQNAESQALLTLAQSGGEAVIASARARVDTFFQTALEHDRILYDTAALLDTRRDTLFRVTSSDESEMTAPREWTQVSTHEIRHPTTGSLQGTLVLIAATDAFVPRAAMDRQVGTAGTTFVIDAEKRRIVYRSSGPSRPETLDAVAVREGWAFAVGDLSRAIGSFRYGRGDSARVASFSHVDSSAWTVVTTAAVREFAKPFAQAGTLQLLLVLGITTLALLVFMHFLRGATASLEELTVAAETVGRGTLSPALPVGGQDEVGRLARSFATMTVRLREMVTQIEVSRQMTVLGEFASQVAHEIRNPLTAIKLNLQGLARDAEAGLLPAHSRKSVQLSVREIDRLDGVVRGVLDLARTSPPHRETVSVGELVSDALTLARPHATTAGVRFECEVDDNALVCCDRSQIQGAMLNLLLNAISSSPREAGVRVHVRLTDSANPAWVSVFVRDVGPGVRIEDREKIFLPFYTTRHDGTGLGLPIARRAVEANGGRLVLSPPRSEGGAEFVIELPTAGDSARRLPNQTGATLA